MITITVSEKFQLTDNSVCLRFISSNGKQLPTATPGSHIDIHLANGLIRQYSLCSEIGANYYEIAVLKENNGRGGSSFIHSDINIGDKLEISEPKNLFSLEENADEALLFAAGIGITPILSMAEHLSHTNTQFSLHYCAKNSASAPYYKRIVNSNLKENTSFHFSQEQNSSRLNIPQVITSPSSNKHLYVCGPEQFINEVITQAEAKGWKANNIHREYFSNSALENATYENFEVEIQSSGEVLQVTEDESILDVLEDNGIFIPVACEEGVCGTCLTGLIKGEADHRDTFMTKDEKAQMNKITLCCSRAKSSRLVLDL